MMPATVQISFHNMEPSTAAEAQVRRLAEGLGHYCDRIAACRVVLDAGHRSQRQGSIYQVRVDLSVPGSTLMVAREPGHDHGHEELAVAIRDAFDAARRRLKDHMGRLATATKQGAPPTGEAE
jgi:Sigma 54 modulation protein / S30EA ribosomal protein